MVRSIILAVWVCVVLSGSVYGFTLLNSGRVGASNDPADGKVEVEHVDLETISVSIVQSADLVGYLILNPVYVIRAEAVRNPQTIEFTVRDQIVERILNAEGLDVLKLQDFDLASFKAGVLEQVNKKLGNDIITDILIPQIDFLSKEEIRDNQLRRG